MKKLLSLLLALIMVFSLLAACGDDGFVADDDDDEETEETDPTGTDPTGGDNTGDNGNNPGNNGNNPGGNTTATGLLAAANKLKTSNSYTLKIVIGQKAGEQSMSTTAQFQVSKTTGAILATQKNVYTQGQMTQEQDGDSAFYQGTTGYVLESYNEDVDKLISDVPFTAEYAVSDNDIEISYDSNSLLGLFDSWNPTKTTNADGSTKLTAQITPAQWAQLYAALIGEEVPEDVRSTLSNPAAFGTVSKEGYLTGFCMQVNATQDGETMEVSVDVAVENINATTVVTPDFATNFQLTEGSRITYISGQVQAHYRYTQDWYGDHYGDVMVFEGIGTYYDDDYTVPVYTILSSVEGIPVVLMYDVVYNGSVKVENLVIPTGVQVEIRGTYDEDGYTSGAEETTLFFEDAEADVDKNFYLPGETPDNLYNDAPYVKAAYYAGQWQMVNGVPTPL